MTEIGENAFCSCGLTSVEIPGSVKAIEDCCFEGKTALKRVVIEDGVKYIRAYAFRNCRNLEEVTIPDSVCSIGGFGPGGNPFQGCKRVKVIAKPGS